MDEYLIKVDAEAIDVVVLEYLKEGYLSNESFPAEPGYKKLRKAFRTLIKHHSTTDQWERWKALNC